MNAPGEEEARMKIYEATDYRDHLDHAYATLSHIRVLLRAASANLEMARDAMTRLEAMIHSAKREG